MASFNRVMLMGNLTRDIDLRYLPSGMAVADFAIAVNEKRKANDGQWVEDVSFFDITLFGRTAEVASEYLSKGSPIFVEGRLKQDSWENKEGQKRSKVKVIGERMQMIGGRSDQPNESRSNESRTNHSRTAGVRESAAQSGSEGNHYVNSSTPASRDSHPTGDGPGYEEPDIPF